MAIEFECPACGAVLAAPDRLSGTVTPCDRCGASLRVPDAAPTSPVAARRRGPAPERSGCAKVFVWLVVIGFLILTCCCGSGVTMYVAFGPEWREVRSEAGGYTVDLPADPRDDMAQFAAKHGPVQPGVKYDGTILIGRLEEYSIVYADIAPKVRRTNTDEEILDSAVEGMKNAKPGPVVRASKAVTVSGFPGRELELQVDGQKLLARVVVADTRLYTIVAGGPLARRGEDRLRRFVDSFKLNDPKGAPAKKADPDDEPE